MNELLKLWLPPRLLYFLQETRLSIKYIKRNSKNEFVKNLNLKNIHTNQRCFIIGTGSSIKQQDLKLLKDEIVLGVSGLFVHKDIDIINPNYYVLAPVFEYHSQYNKHEKYISWLKDMDKSLNNDTIMFVHIGDKKYLDENNIFKNKTIYWNDYSFWNETRSIKEVYLNKIPAIFSVSETAIFTAIYLGFKEIYLIGFDHDWYVDTYVYFDNESYLKHWDGLVKKSKELGVDSEFQMRRHAQIFNKYKKLFALKQNIFNANANLNSYVDTFPKVKYEELFNDRNS